VASSVEVAAPGSVRQPYVCNHCVTPMYYRVDLDGKPLARFCPNSECPAWLVDVHMEPADGE